MKSSAISIIVVALVVVGEVDGNAFDEDGTESKPGSFTTTNPTAPTTTKATTIIDIAELFMLKLVKVLVYCL